MTRTAIAAAWAVGILTLGTSLVPVVNGPQGYDTAPLTTAVHALLHGGEVYTGSGAGDFLYPPSALALLLPLGAVGVAWAGRAFFVVDLVSILVATAMLLKLFGLHWRGVAGAVALFGLGLAWPVIFTIDAGNVNGPVLLGLAAFLLAANRGRWLVAGVCLGVTLALKPILVPVLVVVAIYRRWAALGVAVALPVVLSAPLLLGVPATRAFFHTTVPMLFHGQNAQIQAASVSLRSAATRLSIPDAVAYSAEVAVVLITAALLWRRSRGSAAEPRRLVEVTTIALVGAFLLSSFAFSHYGIFLLPFAISLVDRTSPHRHWLTVGALFCIAARQSWGLSRLPQRLDDVLAQRFTFALLFLLLAFWLGMRREAARSVNLASAPVLTPTAERAETAPLG